MLLNVIDTTYFKFELQLQFRNSSIIVNLYPGLRQKYINLKLIIRKNKNSNEKRTTHWYSVTFVLVKPLKYLLIDVTSFRYTKSLYSRYFFFVSTYNFGSDFPYLLDGRIYETIFLTHVSSFSFRFIALSSLFPVTHFYYRLSRPQGHGTVGRIMQMTCSNDTVGNRNHDLPACNAVPQPTALPLSRSPKTSLT
jgi:hypothetical protein